MNELRMRSALRIWSAALSAIRRTRALLVAATCHHSDYLVRSMFEAWRCVVVDFRVVGGSSLSVSACTRPTGHHQKLDSGDVGSAITCGHRHTQPIDHRMRGPLHSTEEHSSLCVGTQTDVGVTTLGVNDAHCMQQMSMSTASIGSAACRQHVARSSSCTRSQDRDTRAGIHLLGVSLVKIGPRDTLVGKPVALHCDTTHDLAQDPFGPCHTAALAVTSAGCQRAALMCMSADQSFGRCSIAGVDRGAPWRLHACSTAATYANAISDGGRDPGEGHKAPSVTMKSAESCPEPSGHNSLPIDGVVTHGTSSTWAPTIQLCGNKPAEGQETIRVAIKSADISCEPSRGCNVPNEHLDALSACPTCTQASPVCRSQQIKLPEAFPESPYCGVLTDHLQGSNATLTCAEASQECLRCSLPLPPQVDAEGTPAGGMNFWTFPVESIPTSPALDSCTASTPPTSWTQTTLIESHAASPTHCMHPPNNPTAPSLVSAPALHVLDSTLCVSEPVSPHRACGASTAPTLADVPPAPVPKQVEMTRTKTATPAKPCDKRPHTARALPCGPSPVLALPETRHASRTVCRPTMLPTSHSAQCAAGSDGARCCQDTPARLRKPMLGFMKSGTRAAVKGSKGAHGHRRHSSPLYIPPRAVPSPDITMLSCRRQRNSDVSSCRSRRRVDITNTGSPEALTFPRPPPHASVGTPTLPSSLGQATKHSVLPIAQFLPASAVGYSRGTRSIAGNSLPASALGYPRGTRTIARNYRTRGLPLVSPLPTQSTLSRGSMRGCGLSRKGRHSHRHAARVTTAATPCIAHALSGHQTSRSRSCCGNALSSRGRCPATGVVRGVFSDTASRTRTSHGDVHGCGDQKICANTQAAPAGLIANEAPVNQQESQRVARREDSTAVTLPSGLHTLNRDLDTSRSWRDSGSLKHTSVEVPVEARAVPEPVLQSFSADSGISAPCVASHAPSLLTTQWLSELGSPNHLDNSTPPPTSALPTTKPPSELSRSDSDSATPHAPPPPSGLLASQQPQQLPCPWELDSSHLHAWSCLSAPQNMSVMWAMSSQEAGQALLAQSVHPGNAGPKEQSPNNLTCIMASIIGKAKYREGANTCVSKIAQDRILG
jgi:hypothetical protein